MLAALIRLFTSFINCAWPGRSPTSNTFLPIRASSGRMSSSAAARACGDHRQRAGARTLRSTADRAVHQRDAARSPATVRCEPSRHCRWWTSRHRYAGRVSPPLPPPPARSTAPVGRQANTIGAACATAAADAASTAPRSTKGATATGSGSNTCSRASSLSSRSAIAAPIWPRPRNPTSMSHLRWDDDTRRRPAHCWAIR